MNRHRPKCTCLSGYRGNPYDICRKIECLTDPECPDDKACRNEKCVDPCDCAPNALCTARNHRGYCTCPPGYTGDPYQGGCTKIPEIIPDVGCKEDRECQSKHACIIENGYGTCRNPCLVYEPCARDARCEVHDELPLRVMSCTCLPGYTGKGDVRCEKILVPEPFSCDTDNDCSATQACRNGDCVNPCAVDKPCVELATCTVNNHRARCECPPGYEGDGFSSCTKIRKGECEHDVDCPDNRACIQHQCLDPCVLLDPCGNEAVCETTSHRPVCRCPAGWGGNPHEGCYQYECRKDPDCPFDKACVAEECVDPCKRIECGRRAECKAEQHRAVCYCPRGLQGNPIVACEEVGCTSNDDCASTEKCDFLSGSNTRKECQPLCVGRVCAQGASCEAVNHQEICTCNYPLQGDGYVTCYERKHELCMVLSTFSMILIFIREYFKKKHFTYLSISLLP